MAVLKRQRCDLRSYFGLTKGGTRTSSEALELCMALLQAAHMFDKFIDFLILYTADGFVD